MYISLRVFVENVIFKNVDFSKSYYIYQLLMGHSVHNNIN